MFLTSILCVVLYSSHVKTTELLKWHIGFIMDQSTYSLILHSFREHLEIISPAAWHYFILLTQCKLNNFLYALYNCLTRNTVQTTVIVLLIQIKFTYILFLCVHSVFFTLSCNVRHVKLHVHCLNEFKFLLYQLAYDGTGNGYTLRIWGDILTRTSPLQQLSFFDLQAFGGSRQSIIMTDER